LLNTLRALSYIKSVYRQKQLRHLIVLAEEIDHRNSKGIRKQSNCWQRWLMDTKLIPTDPCSGNLLGSIAISATGR